jgi:hypothetical protein
LRSLINYIQKFDILVLLRLITSVAAWPSGKAEDCKSFTPSSNLGAAFFYK